MALNDSTRLRFAVKALLSLGAATAALAVYAPDQAVGDRGDQNVGVGDADHHVHIGDGDRAGSERVT